MRELFIFITTLFCFGTLRGQNPPVVLNHFYVSVDIETYQAIKASHLFTSDIALSYEKNKNWEGIYFIGSENYIEIFHPLSIPNEYIPVGFSWICLSSLQPNFLEHLDVTNHPQFSFESDDNYDDLSVFTKDSIYVKNSASLISTMEMNRKRYESWTQKKWNDTLPFSPVDYNSPIESDSSLNFAFDNVAGLDLIVNTKDLNNLCSYLELVGYEKEAHSSSSIKYSNGKDFISIETSDEISLASIKSIHLTFDQFIPQKRLIIGTTVLQIFGKAGQWDLITTN